MRWFYIAAIDAWEIIEEDTINELIETMPERMQAIIDADGWYTYY